MKKISESSRQEKPPKKNKQFISKTMKKPKNLSNADNAIDLSDIPEINLQQLGNPLIGKFYRPKKQLISIRLDADVLYWFKTYPQYQKLINQVCRLYMHQKKHTILTRSIVG